MKKKDKSKTKKAVTGVVIGLFSIPGIIMTVRLVMKMVDASISIGFVRFWYDISDTIYDFFEGTFNDVIFGSIIIEVDTLVSLLFFAVLAFLTIQFINVLFRENLRGVLLSFVNAVFRTLQFLFLFRLLLKFFFADVSNFTEFVFDKTDFAYNFLKDFFPSISLGTYVFEFPSFVFFLLLIVLNIVFVALIKQIFKVGTMPTEHVNKVAKDSPLKSDDKDSKEKKQDKKEELVTSPKQTSEADKNQVIPVDTSVISQADQSSDAMNQQNQQVGASASQDVENSSVLQPVQQPIPDQKMQTQEQNIASVQPSGQTTGSQTTEPLQVSSSQNAGQQQFQQTDSQQEPISSQQLQQSQVPEPDQAQQVQQSQLQQAQQIPPQQQQDNQLVSEQENVTQQGLQQNYNPAINLTQKVDNQKPIEKKAVSKDEMVKLAQPHDTIPNPDIQALQTGGTYFKGTEDMNTDSELQGTIPSQQIEPTSSQQQPTPNQPIINNQPTPPVQPGTQQSANENINGQGGVAQENNQIPQQNTVPGNVEGDNKQSQPGTNVHKIPNSNPLSP